MAEVKLSKSNYWKKAVLDAALRGVDFVAPKPSCVALFLTDPLADGTGDEVTGEHYVRVYITFGEPIIDGDMAVTSNDEDCVFPIAAGDWGKVTHIGIFDSVIGGNMLYHGAVEKPRTIEEHDRLRFLAGSMVISEG